MNVYDAQIKAYKGEIRSIGLFTDRDAALETCMSILRTVYPDVDFVVAKESGNICMRGADTGGWEWFGIVYDRTCDNPEGVKQAAQYLRPDQELVARVGGMLAQRDVSPDEQASAAPSSEHAYAQDLSNRIAAVIASSGKEWVTTSEVVQALRKKDALNPKEQEDEGDAE